MLLPSGTQPAGSPTAPDQLYSVSLVGFLLDLPHFRKSGFKRVKFEREPARPVSFFPHVIQARSNHKLVRTARDGAQIGVPQPRSVTFIFLC